MVEMKDIFFGIALLLTFASAISYLAYFITESDKSRSYGRFLLVLSGIAQTLYVADRAVLLSNLPVTTGHEALVFFGWAVTWAFLSFKWRYSVRNLGTLVAFFVFVVLLIASLLPMDIVPLKPEQQTYWLPFHAGVSLLAYGFLGIAFLGGLMYLLQERQLKKKKFGYLFSRLPSLDTLDILNNHCLTVGFAFLTCGLIAGGLWARVVHGGWQIDWTIMAWFFYLVQMHQRLTVGWRGRRAAIMAICGFVLAILTLWGVAYLSGGIHGNG